AEPGLASSQERFRWRYSADELDDRVPDLHGMKQQAEAVHILMNNNYGSYAVDGARYLRDRLSPLSGTQMRWWD
ncbi:MAG: DUF72 domain-containing protein, partial [Clostridia bacterium]